MKNDRKFTESLREGVSETIDEIKKNMDAATNEEDKNLSSEISRKEFHKEVFAGKEIKDKIAAIKTFTVPTDVYELEATMEHFFDLSCTNRNESCEFCKTYAKTILEKYDIAFNEYKQRSTDNKKIQYFNKKRWILRLKYIVKWHIVGFVAILIASISVIYLLIAGLFK